VKQDLAETIALRALAWTLTQPDEIGGFLNATGAAAGDLAGRAGDPLFLAAVLDFLLAEDRRVIAFCDAEGLDYGQPMQARAALPGGDLVHWT
jgi:Protein of unknown function (DUF3572)